MGTVRKVHRSEQVEETQAPGTKDDWVVLRKRRMFVRLQGGLGRGSTESAAGGVQKPRCVLGGCLHGPTPCLERRVLLKQETVNNPPEGGPVTSEAQRMWS